MDLKQFLATHVATSTQHTCFYHFTDKRNLPLIRAHGLLSTLILNERGIVIPATGGDAQSLHSDRLNGTDKFVRLCFTDNHPMAFVAANDDRQRDFVYLMIRPDIMLAKGAMITNAASNQAGVVPGPADQMLDTLDLEILYKRAEWSDPVINARLSAAEKYELLIPDAVPLASIINPNG